MPLRINWNDRIPDHRVHSDIKTHVARAIATWDPDWRDHVWDATLENIPTIMYTFSYKDADGWKSGPLIRDDRDFDKVFRQWTGNWTPTCEYCGEAISLDRMEGHVKSWCIGRWAYRLDSRWTYPFGVYSPQDPDRYRKEKEVTEEIAAFGFRSPGSYWKHVLQPAEQVLLDAGVFNDGSPHWWTRYWVRREVMRAIKPYARIRHIGMDLGYSYYNQRGSLVCSVKWEKDKWYVYSPRRERLPHGFSRRPLAVAFYYPAEDSTVHLLRKYAHESRWPFVSRIARKRYRAA